MTRQSMMKFELVEDWEQKPDKIDHRDVAGVAIDSQGRVYLHTRNDDQTVVFDGDGHYLDAWGYGIFGNAHGITIDGNDAVYCVDNGDHVVRKFTTNGDLQWTIGTPKIPSNTGYAKTGAVQVRIHHNETVQQVAGPFNGCTNLAVAPSGDLYVADGYGNARVHRFSPDGDLIQSWGAIGTGPGEFHLPHGIWVLGDGRVVVADRENDRLQFFNPAGEYLDMWTDVQRPTAVTAGNDGLVYVSELWRPCEPGQGSFVHGLPEVDRPGRVSVFDPSGRVVARWGAASEKGRPGTFIAPHDIALDADGNVYVAEVTYTFGIGPGRVVPELGGHQIQKFRRK